MSDRVRWIEHKGTKILYADYSESSEEEYIETIEEFKNELLKQPLGSVVTLTDVANSTITEKVTEKYKELNEQTKGISKAAAAIGVTGFKRVLAGLVKRDLHLANSMEEAIDWLVEQAK